MLAKIPRWILVLCLGAGLLFPLLGSYGLWDPYEIKQADVARDVVEKNSFADVTIDGQYSPRPPLYVWLVACGFKVLGVNELAGRLPLALCGLLALLLAYRVGRRLMSPGGGLAAAFVLGTTPVFLFQSRQLTSDVIYYASLIAAVGGLAAYLWPADGRRSRLDLLVGGLGLVAGFLSRGLAMGVAFPLLSFAIAVACSWRSAHEPLDAAWPAEEGPQLGRGDTVGEALRSAALPLLVTVGLAGAAIAALVIKLPMGSYLLLGDEYKPVTLPPGFHIPLRDLGFGMYPWFALLPVALFAFLYRARPAEAPPTIKDVPGADDDAGDALDETTATRDVFPKLLILVLATLSYGAAVFWSAYLGKPRFFALPWLAIAVGLWLNEVRQLRATHRLWALVGAAVILVLQQDFATDPQTLAFSHLTESAKFPAELNIKLPMRLFGVGFAALLFLAFGGAPRPFAATRLTAGRYFPRLSRVPVLGLLVDVIVRRCCFWLVDQLSWLLSALGGKLRRIAGSGERTFWIAGGALALAFAGYCAFYLTPELSLHKSNKELFGTFHRCRDSGQRLSQYLVTGRGAAYYNQGQVDAVRTQADLFKLLQAPTRSFVLIPSNQLGAIDRAARQAKLTYYVLDDSNSQYLILSNQLAGRCNADLNPLRRLVLSQRPSPRKTVEANFENRVKLIGYDVDDTVSRVSGKFKITFYYQVLAAMPANYKVFIHFDQPAHRFHGDHTPLEGKYPTQYWLPGDYIVDPTEVEIPLLTTPSGSYTIYAGFWLGSTRLKVVQGANDGNDRVRVGTFRVR